MNSKAIWSLIGTLAFSVWNAPETAGQNALGDGTALDANHGVGTGGRNVGSPQMDMRLRNLLVTNNVAGGRGFRAAVGYLGTEDFRADTGSDDIFAFERRSALSSLNAINSGFNMSNAALFLGQDRALVEYRRSSAGTSLHAAQGDTLRLEADESPFAIRSQIDRLVLSHQQQGRGVVDQGDLLLLGQYPVEGGLPVNVTASSLRGLQMMPAGADVRAIGLSMYDRARLTDGMLTGGDRVQPGLPFTYALNGATLVDGRLTPATVDARMRNAIPPGYQAVMDQLASTQAAESGTEKPGDSLETELARIRAWLDEDEETVEPAAGAAPPGNVLPTTPEAEPRDEPADGPPPLDLPDGLDLTLLRHGGVITSLAPVSADRFTEILADAEKNLRDRQYLTAERRFVRALRYLPEHPTALAGLANAQIGAGLIESAGLTLRELFSKHPELIDASYGPDILPPAERLAEIVGSIRTRVAEGKESVGHAVCLAYLGRQIGDRALIAEGLDYLEAVSPEDPLLRVLRGVWLEQPAPDAPPAAGDSPTSGE